MWTTSNVLHYWMESTNTHQVGQSHEKNTSRKYPINYATAPYMYSRWYGMVWYGDGWYSMVWYGMETYEDSLNYATAPYMYTVDDMAWYGDVRRCSDYFLNSELDHGTGHIRHILLRAHQHLELGYTPEVTEDTHGCILLIKPHCTK